MARRRREEESDNHDRWLVSYADFITLLFALFVVMYSISSVNEDKYRVLSATLTDAFQTSAQSLNPIQIGEQVRMPDPVAGEFAAPELARKAERMDQEAEQMAGEGPGPTGLDFASLSRIAADLKGELSPFIDQDLVKVTQTERGLEVEMKSRMLFKSGSSRLSRDAVKALGDVAAILKPLPNQIKVEGHTDDLPIKTVSFPSNWELSAARAASVVHLFARRGVSPDRMSAIGYGEFRPVTENGDEASRAKNRRVAIIIMAARQQREQRDVGELKVAGTPAT